MAASIAFHTTGELTSDTLIATGRSLLGGVHILTDGVNPATVIIYDETSATGDKMFESVVAGADESRYFDLPVLQAKTGIYMDIAGTGASCIVYTG